MWQDLVDYVGRNETLVWGAVGVSLAVFVGSLVLMPVLVARLPRNYFAAYERPETWLERRHRVLRVALLVVKNAVGAVLLVAGIAMLVLPGQGILTILAAVVLLDFPGKRRLELAAVRWRRIRDALNWIRRRAGKAPFAAPPTR